MQENVSWLLSWDNTTSWFDLHVLPLMACKFKTLHNLSHKRQLTSVRINFGFTWYSNVSNSKAAASSNPYAEENCSRQGAKHCSDRTTGNVTVKQVSIKQDLQLPAFQFPSNLLFQNNLVSRSLSWPSLKWNMANFGDYDFLVQNITAIHLIIEIFKSGPTWLNNRCCCS